MIELKTPAEIARMHVAGRFVAEALSEVGRLADVGVNLLDLEHHVRGMIKRRGAESCYWDYAPSFGKGPFRNEISRASLDALVESARPGVPEAVLVADMLRAQVARGAEPQVFTFLSSGPVEHPRGEAWRLLHGTEPPGAPTMRPLGEGDAVVTEYHTSYGGYLAGAEFTIYIGQSAPQRLQAIFDVCVETLEVSARVLRPGVTIREACTAIRRPAERAGIDFVELGFHGHGLASPEFPTVVHRPGHGAPRSMDGTGIGDLVIREGMVLCNNIDLLDPAWKPDVGCMYGDTMVVGPEATTRLVGVPTEMSCSG